MILAFSLGDSVVNHFARRLEISVHVLEGFRRKDVRLCPALRAGSGSYEELARSVNRFQCLSYLIAMTSYRSVQLCCFVSSTVMSIVR